MDKQSKRVIIWYPRNGARNRGRQNKKWSDDIEKTSEKLWIRSAKDRLLWKELEEAYAKGHTDHNQQAIDRWF